MELILNELSFDGQFSTEDDFMEYARGTLMPLLDVVIENEIPLLKKSDIYSYKITGNSDLQDLLWQANNPAMTMLKGYIVNLGYCEPYWDLPALTNPEVKYEYPALSEEPNCFTEVIERGGKLLSLQQSGYDSPGFLCKRDGEEMEISNITEAGKLLKEMLLEDKTKIRYIIERYPYKRSVVCVEIGGKCYAEEALLGNDLEISDLVHVVEAVSQLIADLEQGRKSSLWDKIQEDIFELRLHVNSDRIFRLFFTQLGGIQFLNGFIKKTQKTPSAEITKAIEIKRQIH